MNLMPFDPVKPDDSFLDPDGDVGRRVLAAAMRSTPHPRARRSRTLAAGLVPAALLAALVVAIPNGESARAAIASAAERTAEFASGHVAWHLQTQEGEVSTDIRFDGADSAVVLDRRIQAADGTSQRASLESREVGGRIYELRNHAWQDVRSASSDMPSSSLATLVPGDGLVELLAATTEITRSGDTFEGTLPLRQLESQLPAAYLAVLGSPNGSLDEVATLTARTSDAGLLSRLEFRTTSSTLTVEYSELGTPQQISRPVARR